MDHPPSERKCHSPAVDRLKKGRASRNVTHVRHSGNWNFFFSLIINWKEEEEEEEETRNKLRRVLTKDGEDDAVAWADL